MKSAVVRRNDPEEGRFTILSVHGRAEDARIAWNPLSEEADIDTARVDDDAKSGYVGDMDEIDRPSSMRNAGRDIELDYND